MENMFEKYLDMYEDMAMNYADALLTQARERGAVNVFGVELRANAFEGLKSILESRFNAKTTML